MATDTVNLSDLELENLIVHQAQRLMVFNTSSKGLRLLLEKEFERRLRVILSKIYKRLAKLLMLERIFLAAELRSFRLPLNLRQRKFQANIDIENLLAPFLSEVEKFPEMETVKFIHRLFSRRFYDLGAVSGLQVMGVSASSPRLERVKRTLNVKKTGEQSIFKLLDNAILFALENSAIRFTRGLSREVLTDARNIIRDEIYLGGGNDETAASLISSNLGLIRSRALKVARTEAQQAVNKATFDMYARSGVKQKEWITVGDDRVRPWHVANEAIGRIPIDRPFPSGQMHPGEGALSINCRCGLIADLSDPRISLVPWDGSSGPFLSL